MEKSELKIGLYTHITTSIIIYDIIDLFAIKNEMEIYFYTCPTKFRDYEHNWSEKQMMNAPLFLETYHNIKYERGEL